MKHFYFEFHTQPSRSVLCRKFTGKHPCRNAISIKLQSNFIKNALRHGFSTVNFLYIFRTLSPKNTSEWLLLESKNISCSLRNGPVFSLSPASSNQFETNLVFRADLNWNSFSEFQLHSS